MLHRKALLISMMLAFMMIAAVTFAANQTTAEWIPFDQITAVQTDADVFSLATPVAYLDIGQHVAVTFDNAEKTVYRISHVDAVLGSRLGSFFQVYVAVSPQAKQLIYAQTSDQFMMRKSVVVESTPIAKTQVETIKQPMMVAGMGYNHQIDVFAVTVKNTGLSGIDQMAVAEVSPNVTAGSIHNGGFTAAFQRDFIINGSIATLDAGSTIIIGDTAKTLKVAVESIKGSCSDAGTIFFT